MKTIGVLGGLGPQATMDFERRVHEAARRVIRPHFNAGYPPMVVWYCRHPPAVVDEAGRPVPPFRPEPRLLEAARWLGQVADFLVITSNGVHLLRPQIEAAAGRPVVSMVDAVIAEARRRGWGRVGVLALGEPLVYAGPMREMGVMCETISGAMRDALDAALFKVMEGREDDASRAAARAAVAELRGRGVDGVVLGCTELPFLVDAEELEAADLINSTAVLAEVAVREAVGEGDGAGRGPQAGRLNVCGRSTLG